MIYICILLTKFNLHDCILAVDDGCMCPRHILVSVVRCYIPTRYSMILVSGPTLMLSASVVAIGSNSTGRFGCLGLNVNCIQFHLYGVYKVIAAEMFCAIHCFLLCNYHSKVMKYQVFACSKEPLRHQYQSCVGKPWHCTFSPKGSLATRDWYYGHDWQYRTEFH